MIKRCDDKFDCKDKSDENQCNKVFLDGKFYNNDIPPYIIGSNVRINVSIYLSSVDNIILPSTFDTKFLLELTWKDYRITYHDLQEVNIINDETRESIWIPPLIFSNSKDNEILKNDEKTIISILKMAQPKFNSYKELHETTVYEGSQTLIKYHRKYSMIIICHYQLQYYPFDHQICTIDVEIPILLQDYIDIFPQRTGNLGVSELDQFLITKTEIQSKKNHSLIQCKIFMKRIPWYHIATTYMPILFVIFLALITLCIDQSHFDAIIMVSLTCMLVMYTLFQSIATNMPTTISLKLLDYWLIFGMIMPFIVFTVLISLELLDEYHKRKFPFSKNLMNTQGNFVRIHNKIIDVQDVPKNVSDESSHKRPSDKTILHHAKWFLPLITIAFVTSYTAVVVFVYQEYDY